jgi:beta-xylosidase
MKYVVLFVVCLVFGNKGTAQPWTSDVGDGTYKNPVLFADYSDPDVIHVGDDFYMVASSFNCMPGLPILHSKDLVNWSIVNHVYKSLPFERYESPAHGMGSWAPSIRHHNGIFYVYFCTPTEGLFVATAKDPKGEWKLEHVEKVELWEDPCPLWDDDGNAYLVRSKLRADVLYLHRMSPDGKKILDNGTVIFTNLDRQPIIEGPKFLKKDGYYYILAPAGSVPAGWQTVLRSKTIYGPYEDKIVLHTGDTQINGPHQGGMVELKSGEWWFMHFQDRGPYGRIVHLQPVRWIDGWPIMGEDKNKDGIGEPVMTWKKPAVLGSNSVSVPQTSDDFSAKALGLQWQWHANPKESWYSLNAAPGMLRLHAVKNYTQQGNFWFVPNLLLQKFSSPVFTATTLVDAHLESEGERSGLVIMGEEWAYLSVTMTKDGLQVGMYTGSYFQGYDKTELKASAPLRQSKCFLKVDVDAEARCRFSYSLDGKKYQSVGDAFQAKKGRWIGAKVGLFSINPNIAETKGYADFDFFDMK